MRTFLFAILFVAVGPGAAYLFIAACVGFLAFVSLGLPDGVLGDRVRRLERLPLRGPDGVEVRNPMSALCSSPVNSASSRAERP